MDSVSTSLGSNGSTDDRPRCGICRRKLNLVEQNAGICKCKQMFCAKHRCVRKHPTDDNTKCHPCSFDYLAEQKQLISNQNPVVLASKLSGI
jgi:hypothetical protein